MQRSIASLLLLALVGCASADPRGKPDPSDSAAPAAALDFGQSSARNVIVIQVDTLRADALPAWGSERNTTPVLGLRAGWMTVERAVSTASWTVPATASLLTGIDLPAHGLRYFDATGPVGTLVAPTFPEHLRERGFATGLVTGSNVILGPANQVARGFDLVRDVSANPENAARTVTDGLAWIEGLDPAQPFLLVLQPTDPHVPYRPQDGDLGTWSDPDALPFDVDASIGEQERQINAAYQSAPTSAARAAVRGQVRAVYDEQILGVDRAVDTLIAGLERLGRAGDTLVVLTADHGETFFDGTPTHLGHGYSARNEIVHVPLQFWGAGLREEHVDCVASNMDVFPTVLDVLGVEPLPGIEGRSLREGCRANAFSGVYEAGDDGEIVTWLSVEALGAQVVRECATGTTYAFDLDDDPAAAHVAAVPAVPDGPALEAALDGYAAALTAALPSLRCAP